MMSSPSLVFSLGVWLDANNGRGLRQSLAGHRRARHQPEHAQLIYLSEDTPARRCGDDPAHPLDPRGAGGRATCGLVARPTGGIADRGPEALPSCTNPAPASQGRACPAGRQRSSGVQRAGVGCNVAPGSWQTPSAPGAAYRIPRRPCLIGSSPQPRGVGR